MRLRPYQEKIIDKVKQAWGNGYKSPCIVAPCGAGKSVILAEMASRATNNKKLVYFIVHRKELCDQIENTFKSYGVDMNYCKIFMVQTLVRRLKNVDIPDLLLVDENHHSTSSSYIKIFNHFNCYKIGVTATPIRLSGEGFENINDILIDSVNAEWLIDNKYLSPATVYSAPLCDVSDLKTKAGDYDKKISADALDKNVIYGDIIKHWVDKAINKKTIVYCSTVKHAENTAEKFRQNGINAASIDGTTNKIERDNIIQMFRNGEITVLTNCDIVSEGFDIPDCECVILLRPTKSLTLFIQQSMRCMRYKENKKGIILDHVANTFRHGLPWQTREWSLKGVKKNKKKKDILAENIYTCDLCFCSWDKSFGRECPQCGELKELKKNDIKNDSSIELIEIKKEMFKNEPYAHYQDIKTFEDMCIFQKAKGYKFGWTIRKCYEQKISIPQKYKYQAAKFYGIHI